MRQIDFLLVGFVKSGTTTLDGILRQDKRIVLPYGTKETHFLDWCGRDGALDFFWSNYYPEKRVTKIAGGIEPCYSRNAELCSQIFGKNVKLLFMMRNPIKADYSLFTMGLKWGGSKKLNCWLKKYSADQLPELYHHYTVWRLKHLEAEDVIRDEFCYEKWIQEYSRYYNRDQMKFILFEDFISDPENVVREIEEFIGLESRKLNCRLHKNEGGGVINRNYLSANINYLLTEMRRVMELRGDLENRRRLGIVQEKLLRFTLVQNNEKMLKKTEKALERYYKPTKDYVEQLLNRDLSEIWF